MGSVAKSYMRKGFLIYVCEEMRKYLVIYEGAVSHIWLYNCSRLNFLIYEENFLSFFISVGCPDWYEFGLITWVAEIFLCTVEIFRTFWRVRTLDPGLARTTTATWTNMKTTLRRTSNSRTTFGRRESQWRRCGRLLELIQLSAGSMVRTVLEFLNDLWVLEPSRNRVIVPARQDT